MKLGVDIVEIHRIDMMIKRNNSQLLDRILTEYEKSTIGDISENCERLAGFWAAKEAAVKALGTGFRAGISFHDMEIHHDELGCPYYFFSGEFLRIMQEKKFQHSALSISHCKSHAIATAILS
ncbi:holo-ACP synthase [Providencia rettgeri]|uniref:holo-ACP synthase n=1 Tax=Providencia TaxID=586 RepID=UPI001B35AE92|nr:MULTISPECIES: holo-ACP synthase [Providencia]UNJ79948.1 Holo-[acyl-carrier protein] synthase [Providencia sp.]EHZ7764139.1 holo-ACP synthase [Providencia rettgeri]EIJ7167281.1 holo-ACP synthase [Providencia rettgeri]EJD6048513.1 holo-ACP synthase [Providencia rettgeri]EJD6477736.1 holo-ACP synthase [Providencia rettgeri]